MNRKTKKDKRPLISKLRSEHHPTKRHKSGKEYNRQKEKKVRYDRYDEE